MSNIGIDFYAANELRAYPIDDAATCLDDSGEFLPPGIIVDCSLRFPNNLGFSAFISAVTVTSTLITILFEISPNFIRTSLLTTPNTTIAFTPLGGINIPAPFTPNKPIAITPAQPGMGGWVVLGRNTDVPYSGTFSTLQQSALLLRCARSYQSLPVNSISAYCQSPAVLTGVVNLIAGNDLDISLNNVNITNVGTVPTISMSLVESATQGVNNAAMYAGSCGARPESNTCDPPAIAQINEILPDANGNINIVFSGSNVVPYPFKDNAGGIAIDVPILLPTLCPPSTNSVAANIGLPSNASDDQCGDDFYFNASDPGLTVVYGTWMSSDAGYTSQNASGIAMAITDREIPPVSIRAVFDLVPEYGQKNNGSIVFGYVAPTTTAAEHYCRVIVDRQAHELRIEQTANHITTVMATTYTPWVHSAHNPELEAINETLTVELRVSISALDLNQNYTITAESNTMFGGGNISAIVNFTPASYGISADYCYTVFHELHAEDIASAS